MMSVVVFALFGAASAFPGLPSFAAAPQFDGGYRAAAPVPQFDVSYQAATVSHAEEASHCVYSEWTPWSACSAACDQPGFSSRSRVILDDGSYGYGHHHSHGHGYGHDDCDTSSLEEWRDCFGEACPITVVAQDCVAADWGLWSACSAPCDNGQRTRTRGVLSEATYGGAPCDFHDEVEDCNNGPCQQDCQQSAWGQWNACASESGQFCGAGSRDRSRVTISRAVFGGFPCGPEEEWEACDLGPCAQDCQQSSWGQWSLCSSSSGQSCGSGSRDRSRFTLSDSINGGFPCGPQEEWEACDLGPCAQDCQQSEWSQWNACSAACGAGSRDRSRFTITQSFNGGNPCGPEQDWEACDNGPCTQDCRQSDWAQWSQCSSPTGQTCGAGRRDRSRFTITESRFGGFPCGSDTEFEACDLGSCAQNCQQSTWSQWGQCSSSCGSGSRDRTRFTITQALNGGLPCGAESEWEACDNGPCQQNCQQSNWGQWSVCASTSGQQCGSGSRDRTRVTISEARFGGASCGSTSEWEACDLGPCQQNCQQSNWGQWSVCASTSGQQCGSGSRDRTRFTISEARFGGASCGATSEWEACDLGSCQQDCRQSQWSQWTQCSASCGPGSRDRTRATLSQSFNGGVPCGPESEWEACDNGPCCDQSSPSHYSSRPSPPVFNPPQLRQASYTPRRPSPPVFNPHASSYQSRSVRLNSPVLSVLPPRPQADFTPLFKNRPRLTYG